MRATTHKIELNEGAGRGPLQHVLELISQAPV